MSAAVSIYIYDHTPSGQSRLYKQTKSSVHGIQFHMLCFETKHTNIPGHDVLLLYTMDRFLPPRLMSVNV